MRTELTPDNTEVQVADVLIRYTDSEEQTAVSVVIDDYLSENIDSILTHEWANSATIWDCPWFDWDNQFFYYFTKEEWDGIRDGIPVSDEWEVVLEATS